MHIACDEAGHTGPDLLASDQRYFAFASVNVSDDEARKLISEARKAHPVQMPELKASKLMGSSPGRRLVAHLVNRLDGRFAISADDKLLALCGWVFEYIFEPVYKDDPVVFYRKDFHRFIAMFCYFWSMDQRSAASESLSQFQAFIRSKDIRDAPLLFEFEGGPVSGQSHPFELIQRIATGHRQAIAKDIAGIERHASHKGKWTLDLSASSLWSHLNHWGRSKEPLVVACDDSKPLRAIEAELDGTGRNAAVARVEALFGERVLGWELERPIEFVDSRAHPSVQLADILAGTAMSCCSNGLPEGMAPTGEFMDKGMLRDSIFPDFERVRLKNGKAKVHYAVLRELAATAEGLGTDVPIEVFFETAEHVLASGELKLD